MWKLTADELTATREKIAKINDRAQRRGFTGRIEITAVRTEVATTNDLGFEVTEELFETEITGEAPSYEGWTFAATLTWDEAAGLVTRTAPGVATIDREGLRPGWCDHCRTDRNRVNTYLVINNATGEQRQVGSTCIKDFLGWKTAPVFLDYASVASEVSETIGGGGWERRWTTETVLAMAWAAIQAYGFVRAGSFDGTPTKYVVAAALDPRTDSDRTLARALAPFAAEAAGQAKIIRAWIASDAFGGGGEYVINMKNVLAADTVGSRNLGLVASAPQTWARGMERDLIRRAQAEEIVNDWLAPVGAKIEFTATVKSIRYSSNAYGTSTVYTLLTDDHHLVTWFASRSVLGDAVDGQVHKLRATVKKHEEFQGTRRTVVTRAKII